MKTVPLSKLHTIDYSVRHVIAHTQFWENGSSWTVPVDGRINSAIMIPLETDIEYKYTDKILLVRKGSMIYLPQGSHYRCTFRNNNKAYTMLQAYELETEKVTYHSSLPIEQLVLRNGGDALPVNTVILGFELYDDDGKIFSLGNEPESLLFSDTECDKYIGDILYICGLYRNSHTDCQRINIAVYKLLYNLSYSAGSRKQAESGYYKIEPAILFLKRQPVVKLVEIKIPYLADLCGLSQSRFRQIFNDVLGVSPVNYILDLRLRHAKGLLSYGTIRVFEAAYQAGFSDALYFSRIFNKKYGCSPSEYRKNLLNMI